LTAKRDSKKLAHSLKNAMFEQIITVHYLRMHLNDIRTTTRPQKLT